MRLQGAGVDVGTVALLGRLGPVRVSFVGYRRLSALSLPFKGYRDRGEDSNRRLAVTAHAAAAFGGLSRIARASALGDGDAA